MADLNAGDSGVPILIYPLYKQYSTTTVLPGSVTITVPSTSIYQAGISLIVDEETTETETITIGSVDSSTTFTATFARPHSGSWTLAGGLIPVGAAVGVAFLGRTTGARVPSAAGTYALAFSQANGAYALYTTTGVDFPATVSDLYDPQLHVSGVGYDLCSVSPSGPISVQRKF